MEGGVYRWIVDVVVVLCVGWIAFVIEMMTGTITSTEVHFRTADVFGITMLWTPGVVFASVVLVVYLVIKRDILGLNGEGNGI